MWPRNSSRITPYDAVSDGEECSLSRLGAHQLETKDVKEQGILVHIKMNKNY